MGVKLGLTLINKHRLRVFENRVLRRIFGPRKDEVTRSWRMLHKEDLHNLYSTISMIRMVKTWKMSWTCSTYWGEEEYI
jgi:hypothetical protein